MRISVSAEVYGEFNKKKDFKPPVNPKEPQVLNDLIKIMEKSFIFAHLEEKEKNICALAMEKVKVEKDKFIIKQGDDGDHLYVVSSGQFECTKQIEGKEVFLVKY